MFALFHLIAVCMKITLLSTFYTSLVLLITTKGNFKLVLSQVKKIVKMKQFPIAYPVIWLLLFVYSFTYYGDHGLGDSAKIPIGHGKIVSSVDHTTTSIRCNNQYIILHQFYTKEDFLYAQTLRSPFSKEINGYLIWDLKVDKYRTFDTEKEFKNFIKEKPQLVNGEFLSFHDAYYLRWGGLRALLLP